MLLSSPHAPREGGFPHAEREGYIPTVGLAAARPTLRLNRVRLMESSLS
jgi:hypothetical protein